MMRILRGSPEAPESSHHQPLFGALVFRSKSAIGRMLQCLIGAKLLRTRRLEHGGVMLELTAGGRRALVDSSVLRLLAAEPEGRTAQRRRTISGPKGKDASASGDASPLAEDEELLERLRAWRREKAHLADAAAFVIAHDAVLRRIVALRPGTEDELLAVKGIGPRKLEKYGAELLALVRGTGEE